MIAGCPVCGFEYSRHVAIEAFERFGGEDGFSLKSTPGLGVWQTSGENPSPRRIAVRIRFEGECGHAWRLDLVQHKGRTFMLLRE